ncbi:hypothetical protein CP532_3590 [Ophiocordyceps camponoti-leonardi (nom. inval.)]|nr:hypothetical protein CP532_3590 [Ophiocordyceps camponoti-leonardi (nom. inval.)]
MPPYSHRAQVALLHTVNRVFELNRATESVDELFDGITLAHVLHELDPEFDPSHLESNAGSSKYLTNKRNIQAVYKGLFRFIRRHVPELGCQAKKFDYHAVAEKPEAQGISQILAVMVAAAAMGPDNGKYVPRIQNGLDRDGQAEIMQILRVIQADTANYKDDEDLDEALDAVMEARDVDLLVEEQNAALRHRLDGTRKNLSDYITRLEHLQQSHDELKYEKEKNDRELEILRKATQDGANSAEAIKLLEAQVHEQMEIIATNEEIIRNHDRMKSHLESEVQRLTQKSMQADELHDQVLEWRHKAEEFEKKANTADRFKQKLEAQQGLAKEVQNLQYERAELQEQLRALIVDQEKSQRTRKAEDELTKMITQSEQHLWDERNQKNQLLKDFATMEEDLGRLKAQRAHDERFIQDLQEQLQQGGGGAPQGEALGALPTASNLEDELNNAAVDEWQPNVPLEMSRLKAENELLRRNLSSTGDVAILRRELEEQKFQRDRLQRDFNDIFEKHTLTQEQISALTVDANSESASQTLITMRSQLLQMQSELKGATRRYRELQSKAADMERDLMSAKGQLSAVEKGGIDAIQELKSTDSLISESLKDELERLREEHRLVVGERDAQKSQLIEALLAKDKFRKELEEGKELQDAAAAASPGADASEAARKSGEKIEKLRARLKERKQQLEQSELDKLDLQNKLKAARGGEDSDALAATNQVIKTLRRENALMSTAWYELTSRLQSNHLVLQRRQDAPRSWLNKQRQMVNATSRKA